MAEYAHQISPFDANQASAQYRNDSAQHTATPESVTVIPRTRVGAPIPAPIEVTLNLDTIRPLFTMKQEDAAKQLRISVTSLKAVCRQLGIARWPYTRGPKATTTREENKTHPPATRSVTSDTTADLEMFSEDNDNSDGQETSGQQFEGSNQRKESEGSGDSLLDEIEGSRTEVMDQVWIEWYMSGTDADCEEIEQSSSSGIVATQYP
ncbi:hypothetical protein GUITHDRAFT_111149 [Guillardia theta CCMP2712]|uniref:RWP-RK domain-containing protein n=1 Tax=Guillardia theta (strain CCMP2712) TaxID=905079 RepID=L1J3U8_GUITC|nr:hypothetical protein GUITHDRAFT_111149 [Guillardia theta CCMP2712]EKX42779.1 hypothetical protein GUITHDRAFT_111149 [Guillardia theta CCMP2712]|eukprot:XP_005829759.1 hypothetical protein GUITHDRAFT_111149 [Guillardia theta CCMP2712]